MARTNFIPSPDFETYKEMFKEHIKLDKREDGVLLAQLWTNGGQAYWSEELHRAIWQFWQVVGADPTVECIIFTCWGDTWLHEIDETSWLDEITDPGYARYEHMYYDGRRMMISMINNVEVPIIGIINGPGAHCECPLAADICLMADDAVIVDGHFNVNLVPGDGIQIVLRELIGQRRANYMMYMNQQITPDLAMKYNLVNEVVPKKDIIKRAYEIADVIMAKPRPIRRLTASTLRRRWKQLIADELDGAFGTEMFGDFCHGVSHAAGNSDCFFSDDMSVQKFAEGEEMEKIRAMAIEEQKKKDAAKK